MTKSECTECQGVGFIPNAKGYRFYTANGRLCGCGMHATLADAARFADELRLWVGEVARIELAAERTAARHARREARRVAV